MDWKKLQNGSDIRGVALDGVEGEPVNLTPDVAHAFGIALCVWLHDKGIGTDHPTIAIGTDPRLSGESLKEGFISGALEQGAHVIDCGLASTPAMFMTTVEKDHPADASMMVTASHLPWNRNGLKFFTARGGFDKEDIAALIDLASKGATLPGRQRGTVEKQDYMSRYCDHLARYITKGVGAPEGTLPLKGDHIVVDAGNGGGGFFARILERLGADTTGSQFLEPDGHFPNHIPNPENAEAMASVCQAVGKSKADLGVIFDTDVDRSAMVDRYGDPINRNSLIALISAIILREHPGTTIVTDSVTSDGLTDFICSLGGVHHRFRRGYRNVINEGIRLNREGHECWLAIETSGHAALRENYFLDDGAYLAAKLIVAAARLRRQGKELQSLIATLRQPKESREIRMKITDPDFRAYGARVLEQFRKDAPKMEGWKLVEPNYEGVRVACTCADEDGWLLLRMSLHDPVLPLNIESNVEGGVEHILSRLKPLLPLLQD